MDVLNPGIVLYNIIRSKSDEQTADRTIAGVQQLIKGEVTYSVNAMENQLELKVNGVDIKVNTLDLKLNNLDAKVSHLDVRVNHLETRMSSLETRMNSLETRMNKLEIKLGELKSEMIDRINAAKLQTILWIVGVGIIQMVFKYLFN